MNLILLGAPASGKGTYSDYIKSNYDFVHISMGDLLRATLKTNSKFCPQIKDAIENGKILQEDITTQILKEYLLKNNFLDNVLLDGFPRGLISKHLLDKFFKVDFVINLDVSKEVIQSRVLNRLVCSKCHKNFSKLTYSKPKCDDCGGELVRRVDDNLEVLNNRLDAFEKITKPVLAEYAKEGKELKIDASVPLKDGFAVIDKFMKKQNVKKFSKNSLSSESLTK